MDFSQALIQIRAGERLYREGWNGKGQHVALWDDEFCVFEPCLFIRTANEKWFPWTPSQSDLLALDWKVVE